LYFIPVFYHIAALPFIHGHARGFLPFGLRLNQAIAQAETVVRKSQQNVSGDLAEQTSAGPVISTENSLASLSQEQQLDKIKDYEAKADDTSVIELVEFLDSQFPTVRKLTANALGRLNAREAIDKLSKLAQNDPETDVQQAAKLALILIKK